VQIEHSLGAKLIIVDFKLTPEAAAFISEVGGIESLFSPAALQNENNYKSSS
jgi:hypothetical protein